MPTQILAPSSPEIPSHHHGEELPAIGRTIIQDFYNSFRFSQGDANLQESIYKALGDFYSSQLLQEERETVASILPALGQRALRLALPKAHLDKDKTVTNEQRKNAADRGISPVAEAFRREWRSFSTWHLEMIDSSEASDFQLNPETVQKIAVGIANRDRIHQTKSRPGRAEDADPHLSYFRDYIVFGKPTGSEAFDTIFAQAHGMITSPEENRVQYAALELAYKWEAAHPGQSFFTPTEQAD